MHVAMAVRLRKWTRKEYERLAELGVFRPDERLELLDGEIFEMTPQGPQHGAATMLAGKILGEMFGPDFHVRTQLPIVPDETSEPEPDIAIVPGKIQDYWNAHPTRPVLIVEVALSSLGHDRTRKGSLYARDGIGDYWIINLESCVLEVYRDPAPDPEAHYGWSYKSRQILRSGQAIVPLACPGGVAHVGDFFFRG